MPFKNLRRGGGLVLTLFKGRGYDVPNAGKRAPLLFLRFALPLGRGFGVGGGAKHAAELL